MLKGRQKICQSIKSIQITTKVRRHFYLKTKKCRQIVPCDRTNTRENNNGRNWALDSGATRTQCLTCLEFERTDNGLSQTNEMESFHDDVFYTTAKFVHAWIQFGRLV